jgi:hypothetical protein
MKSPRMNRVISLLLLLCAFEVLAAESDPPSIPIGLDAYRMWDKWAHHRIGARAYMRSTYDRRGGNEGADASHFLYQLADDFNVTLDVAGPGMLYFVRCNHWHGSPWHYEVDGTDHIVQETSSADPTKPVPASVFIPEKLFPNPLTWTWSITKGADLNWVPMAFEKTFRLGYSRTRYGTGYYIYHLYDRAAKLSQPLRSWNDKTTPEKDVLDLISRSGTDLISDLQGLRVDEVTGKERASVLELSSRGPTVIRAIDISAPRRDAVLLGRGRIRITWDNRPHASIDAPTALFFGAGTLYNRDGREYLVKAFPMNIRYDTNRVHLACYFPMPFFESAKIELIDHVPDTHVKVRSLPLKDPRSHVGYFHATYRDHGKPTPGHDLVLLDTRNAEGGGDWAGNFVGNSWIFSQRGVLTTLEGDPRFFFDDSGSPQAYGTGTEEWGGGGDYWGGRNMTLPFAGHPCGATSFKEAKEPEDLIQSAYRFLLADLMPFGKNAVIQLEHGGNNESTEHYETVTYWYGSPAATLVQTDELKIGDPESEKQHEYQSLDASEPYEITSRYEWGVDALHGKTTYPSHTDRGRKTRGVSEFTLQVDPKNLGVLLRRKLDYSLPNQRAEVFVLNRDGKTLDPAGVWYLAGANTCIYSNPPDELGATQHNVQTSNRRFRDDEFLIPRDLTAGRDKIRVAVKFTPVTIPLFPGHPLNPNDLAWSEIHYKAYSYRFPPVAAGVTRR